MSSNQQKLLNEIKDLLRHLHSEDDDDDDDSYLANFLLDDDDDSFASFPLENNIIKTKSKKRKKSAGRWIAQDESIKIKGKTITKGFFYYGNELLASSEEEEEEDECMYYYGESSNDAALIDDSLSILFDKKYKADSIRGYWISFEDFSAKSRGGYINWLASDRADSNTPQQYLYLYFFGLERRILVDSFDNKVSDNEFKSIFNELNRLYHTFSHDFSLKFRSSCLIEFMFALRFDLLKEHRNETIFTDKIFHLKLHLSLCCNEKKPIPPELALEWINASPQYKYRTASKRCEKVFSRYFTETYKIKYKAGLKLNKNKKKIQFEYSAMSPTLNDVNVKLDLCDPFELKLPIKKLIAIADECAYGLAAYSRYINKNESSKNALEAILLLPELALDEEQLAIITQFKNWLIGQKKKNNSFILVSDFLLQIKKETPEKLAKKEMDSLQHLTKKSGYGFAPDPRYHPAKPMLNGHIFLFEGAIPETYTPSSQCKTVEIILHVGLLLAQLHRVSHQGTLDALHQCINQDMELSEFDKKSLNAYLKWRQHSPITMTGLKLSISKQNKTEKEKIRQTVIHIALTVLQMSPEKIKLLEKIYLLLNLDKSQLLTDIHHSSSQGKSALPSKRSTGKNAAFSFDDATLALHEIETKNVQNMLSAIFNEEEIEENNLEKQHIINSVAHSDEKGNIAGLDAPHAILYQALTAKEKWRRNEVIALCQKSALMIDGALEIINDWSFDQVDAPVLNDEGDIIFVSQDIVEELKG